MTGPLINMGALALILVFVAFLVVAHLQRPSGRYGLRYTISHYLTGLDGPEVDLGFYALAVALALLATTTWWAPEWAYIVAAVGAVGVCWTRTLFVNEDAHLICAGLTFSSIGVADILISVNQGWLLALALAPPVVAIAAFHANETKAIQEKAAAALYVAFVLALTVGRMTGHVHV